MKTKEKNSLKKLELHKLQITPLSDAEKIKIQGGSSSSTLTIFTDPY